jgi:NADPH2:quinone reductase
MQAAAIDRFGPPSALRLHTLPVPEPGSGEVLIALHTAGVGVWDASVRDGSTREGRIKFPLVLGTDGSGIVVARGERVRRVRVGDRVYGYEFGNPKGGFYAEYAAVDAKAVARIPRRLDLREAGAGAVTGLTALQGIDALRLRRGETLLIFGATGAVGTLAIQFAKQRRARVVATASGTAAARLVRRLGADAVIDARGPTVIERLQELAPDGIDAAFALAGGDALERCLELMRPGGRLVHPNGIEPEPRRRRKIRSRGYDAEAGPRQFARLERAVTGARLRVPIAAAYPLAQAARAHRRLEKGRVLGRIVLRIRQR